MPLSHSYGLIALESIIIPRAERQRREIDTGNLEVSIAKRGVLNPIIIDRSGVLIAGERRVETCRKLGLSEIPFRYADELTSLERQIIELEENIKRQDLPWQDIVQAVAKIHELFLEKAAGEDRDWTQEATAEEIGLTQGTLSVYLRVAANMADETVSGASTVREAYGRIDRRDTRKIAEALEDLLGNTKFEPPTHIIERVEGQDVIIPICSPRELAQNLSGIVKRAFPDSEILREDFCEWAAAYDGPRFNLLHCDFPYGVEAFQGPQMGAGRSDEDFRYDDSPTAFETILEVFLSKLDVLASGSAHLMFWYTADSRKVAKLLETFALRAPHWKFYRNPLVWIKSDNAGVAARFRTEPRHIYEIALLAGRGERPLLNPLADAYSAPSDNSLHPSCKPEPVLRHFFKMLVDETTQMLDPTCGSGSSLRAAESLGAKRILGLEINEGFARSAERELEVSRSKARAAKMVASS